MFLACSVSWLPWQHWGSSTMTWRDIGGTGRSTHNDTTNWLPKVHTHTHNPTEILYAHCPARVRPLYTESLCILKHRLICTPGVCHTLTYQSTCFLKFKPPPELNNWDLCRSSYPKLPYTLICTLQHMQGEWSLQPVKYKSLTFLS